jgi:hypothetical protein
VQPRNHTSSHHSDYGSQGTSHPSPSPSTDIQCRHLPHGQDQHFLRSYRAARQAVLSICDRSTETAAAATLFTDLWSSRRSARVLCDEPHLLPFRLRPSGNGQPPKATIPIVSLKSSPSPSLLRGALVFICRAQNGRLTGGRPLSMKPMVAHRFLATVRGQQLSSPWKVACRCYDTKSR